MEKEKLYQNPVLYMDYSDPDVIRVEDAYYMVSSSFTYVPGVPVLRSYDLVHWERIAYCVERVPFDRYARPQHGCGTWAPSIRYHAGNFYVFIPLPDEGIYYTKAQDAFGPWSPLECVTDQIGWIDPCPLWDDDGKVYMVNAFAQSRCGIKHKLQLSTLDPETLKVVGESRIIYDGERDNPTIEGPKFYKKDGYYYIFAPAGGVKTGWQTVLRASNIAGPYEIRTVLNQGSTNINGPHQGAWVTGTDGREWFLHFQDADFFGRIVHLQPMTWHDGWPVMGIDHNEDGIGEPVASWEMPAGYPCKGTITLSDAFDQPELGLMWQWQGNPKAAFYDMLWQQKTLRLNAMHNPYRDENLLWYAPNALTQMIKGPSMKASVRVTLQDAQLKDHAGMGLIGHEYSYVSLARSQEGYQLQFVIGMVEEKTGEGVAREVCQKTVCLNSDTCLIEMHVFPNGQVQYAYQTPTDNNYIPLGNANAAVSTWTGARLALFALNADNKPSSGAGLFTQFQVQ